MYGSKVHAIGIDVGTSKCCVAGVRNGKVEVFENERSKKTTPSIVAFTETMRLVGDDANDQWTLNPLNTVSGIKRILGKSYEDLGNAETKLHFVVNDAGNPRIAVSYREKPMKLLPEQILAMILTKMAQIAEFNLGYRVDKAVISVPTSFDERQRQATADAATIAGLEVLALINEPMAAAITYRDNRGSCDETLMVLDYGGGTLDSGVVRIDDANVELLSAYGEPTIGGIDLDNLLANHYAEEFAREKMHNIHDDVKAMTKLRLKCEQQKHTLTVLTTPVNIQIDCLFKDTDFSSNIRRDRFQMDVCNKYLSQTLFPALDNAMQKSSATKVVLVGGSTRIPFVEERLQKYGKVLDKTVNLDEAVAHGAAIHAALLVGNSWIGNLVLVDHVKGVTVRTNGTKLKVLIDQETDFRSDEENEKLRIVAMNELEKSCLASNNDGIWNTVLDWLHENPMATKEEFVDKKKLVDGSPSRVDPHPTKTKHHPSVSVLRPADDEPITSERMNARCSEANIDNSRNRSESSCLPSCSKPCSCSIL